MDDLRGLVTEAMDAQYFQCVEVKYQLQHAYLFTGNLRSRRVLEEGLAYLIGDSFLSELSFSGTQRADLGNGIDSSGNLLYRRAFLRSR